MSAEIKILVVDDDAGLRKSLSLILTDGGYEVLAASDGQEGLAIAERELPQMILCDVRMPGMGGLEAMKMIRASSQETCVVMISGIENPDIAGRAMTGMGADAFVSKPWQKDELRATIQSAVRQRSAMGSLNSAVPSLSAGH